MHRGKTANQRPDQSSPERTFSKIHSVARLAFVLSADFSATADTGSIALRHAGRTADLAAQKNEKNRNGQRLTSLGLRSFMRCHFWMADLTTHLVIGRRSRLDSRRCGSSRKCCRRTYPFRNLRARPLSLARAAGLTTVPVMRVCSRHHRAVPKPSHSQHSSTNIPRRNHGQVESLPGAWIAR